MVPNTHVTRSSIKTLYDEQPHTQTGDKLPFDSPQYHGNTEDMTCAPNSISSTHFAGSSTKPQRIPIIPYNSSNEKKLSSPGTPLPALSTFLTTPLYNSFTPLPTSHPYFFLCRLTFATLASPRTPWHSNFGAKSSCFIPHFELHFTFCE